VNRVSVADVVYEEAEPFSHLARWYGRLNDVDGLIEVDRQFAEAFGLAGKGDGTAELPVPSKRVLTQSSSRRRTSPGSVGRLNEVVTAETTAEMEGSGGSPTPTDPVDDEFVEKHHSWSRG